MSEKTSPLPTVQPLKTQPAECATTARLPFAFWLLFLITPALVTINVWLTFRLLRQTQANSPEHAFWLLCQTGSTTAERERAFTQLVTAGNKEWRSADLHELNLSGISLPEANLQGAFFVRTIFIGANLSKARFCNGSLEQADLSGANLSEADVSETQLLRATLNKANFRRAEMRGTSIEQVQAENADFMLADLSDANCLMANLTGAKLDGANLSGARLEAAVLKRASLSLTRLDGANLKNADFTDANWWRARGLRIDQIEFLKEKYPPTTDADQALRQDYAKWSGDEGRN